METNPTSENPNEILSVSVADEVGTKDVGPGQGAPDPVESLIGRYVPWTGKVARMVTEEDVPRVMSEAMVLAQLTRMRHGVYDSANAIAHNQIDDKDPLRFFVSNSGEIIINPVIISHTKAPIDSIEACMSFPENPPIKLRRFNVITAKFQYLNESKRLSEVKEDRFSGVDAKVFQHEVAHLNGHCIYDEGASPEDAIGLTEPK